MNEQTINFWNKNTYERHTVTIRYAYEGCRTYTVFLDDEFYSNHSSYRKALDEIVDIIKTFNWSEINPVFA